MQRESYTPLSRTPRECPVCGGTFRSRHAKAKYCSPACKSRAQVKRHPRPCKQCGATFTPTRVEAKFCSRSCANRGRRSGKLWKNPLGYIVRYEPDHPMANGRGRVFEHRWLMAEHLGRMLLPTEVVHHRNGIVDDNRIENLEVMTRSEHGRLHAVERRMAVAA